MIGWTCRVAGSFFRYFGSFSLAEWLSDGPSSWVRVVIASFSIGIAS
ncbi:hypothetical protein [Rossellomorea aquimaris]|nr:hypothetical protein [Rossellomorea aquimaris]